MKTEPYALSPTTGTFAYRKIVGRETEITNLLRILKVQSVSVEEIRRMGKTLLVQKLAYWCNEDLLPNEFKKENFKAKYFTFQSQENLAKLIEYLIRELEGLKKWHQIDFRKTYNVIEKVLKIPKIAAYGVEISIDLPEYKKHWKEIFNNLLDDISNSLQKNDTKLILIFDELPIMLWDWYKQGNHKEAIELLDILRERRQNLERKGLRFIFCGSVGMNIILDTFRSKFKYTGEATNDMMEFSLGAFSEKEVSFLCDCYTLSGFTVENKKENWKLIYQLTNGIPYYIAILFSIIQTENDKQVSAKNIEQAYNAIINNTNNHKAFNQLLERINIYYSEPKEKATTMIAILTFLSKQVDFISEDDIVNGMNLEKETIRKHLYILLSDHYLLREIKDEQRHYKFKYEIFKKWWRINIV